MEKLFLEILGMSLTASVVIVAVLVIRLLLKRAPKQYSYLLWAAVGFRLCCPVSFRSAVSLFNPLNVAWERMEERLREQTGAVANFTAVPEGPAVDAAIPAAVAPETTMAASAMEQSFNWSTVCAVIWCIGMAVLLLYSVISYLRLHRNMETAVRLEGNVYQSDQICSPFILGVIYPKIYIPFGLDPNALRYVLAHERYHLKRKDHIIKLLAFLMLTIHWFNPLCWLAFALMSRDMEMSCDEKVLSWEENIRKAYSITLLSFATNRRFPVPSPLAFGESGVKSRIKNVLRWSKPRLVISIVAVAVCIAVVAVSVTNPKLTPAQAMEALQESISFGGDTVSFIIPKEYDHPEEWDIQVIGRTEDLELHDFFQELNDSGSWEQGRRYSFETSDPHLLSVTFQASLRGYESGGLTWSRELNRNHKTPGAETMNIPVEFAADLDSVPKSVRKAAVARVLAAAETESTGFIFPEDGTIESTQMLFDLGRIQEIEGPWLETVEGVNVEIWRMGYQLHTNTPERFTSMGRTSITEDGWVTPAHSKATYLCFQLEADGTRTDLFQFTEITCSPGDNLFTESIYRRMLDMGLMELPDIINVKNYHFTEDELAIRTLPDFQNLSLEELGAYTVNTDGAGAEGAFSEWCTRFLEDPESVLAYIDTVGELQISTGQSLTTVRQLLCSSIGSLAPLIDSERFAEIIAYQDSYDEIGNDYESLGNH